MEPERYELSEARRYTFELERRDFMRLFGGGLVVMVAAADAAGAGIRTRAARRGAATRRTSPPGCTSTRRAACTSAPARSKSARTSARRSSQTVADELRVPIASITMVMADTDKTPFDQGTFGSLTTPRMAPQLAKAAATAREMLIDQAAARWQADRATLTARDGTDRREGRPRARRTAS